MMAWLTGMGAKGIVRWVWIAGIAVVVLIAVVATKAFIVSAFDKTEELGREAGATGAVLQGQNQTLEQLKDANDAEENLRAGGERNADRYAACLQDNRNTRSCERYNPDAGQ